MLTIDRTVTENECWPVDNAFKRTPICPPRQAPTHMSGTPTAMPSPPAVMNGPGSRPSSAVGRRSDSVDASYTVHDVSAERPPLPQPSLGGAAPQPCGTEAMASQFPVQTHG